MTNTDEIKEQLKDRTQQHLKMLLDTGDDEIRRLSDELQYFLDRREIIKGMLHEQA